VRRKRIKLQNARFKPGIGNVAAIRVVRPQCWTVATVRYRALQAHNGPSFTWPAHGR
jgi:hypothetical protein